MNDIRLELCETIRAACLKAAADAYYDARMSGLCDEGSLERALDAIRSLELDRVIVEFDDHALDS